jgi:hypothetical protein
MGLTMRRIQMALLATLLAGGAGPGPARAEPPTGTGSTKARSAQTWRERSGKRFERSWGVEVVGVRRVASGSMLRFDYRVRDPGRATALTNRKVRPYLIDEATRTALAVPAMENIGELRQVAPLEQDRTYYVIFGNPGGLVKRGGHVTLVIGDLRAEGLVVE